MRHVAHCRPSCPQCRRGVMSGSASGRAASIPGSCTGRPCRRLPRQSSTSCSTRSASEPGPDCPPRDIHADMRVEAVFVPVSTTLVVRRAAVGARLCACAVAQSRRYTAPRRHIDGRRHQTVGRLKAVCGRPPMRCGRAHWQHQRVREAAMITP
jgi:hypothetical protein